jgi:pimeloyl-ACP methyl ester carboxylesterase
MRKGIALMTASSFAGRPASRPPSDGIVDAGLIRLRYREWTPVDGVVTAPPLLLLHGLASSARIWDLVAPSLSQERRVVALDQRGHGLSDKPDDGYDFASIVADDLAAVDALGLGERFVVAGHSWGANVALELAAFHPERVAALLLVDGGFGMLRDRPGVTWEQISRDLAPPRFAGTPREVFLGWVRESIPDAGPEVEEIELNIVELRADDTVAPRLSFEHHMRILRAMWDEDAERLFASVRAPTLYLLAEGLRGEDGAAEEDGFLAAKRRGVELAPQRMIAALRVEINWMSDTVHDIPLQRPGELAARMVNFLRAVDA